MYRARDTKLGREVAVKLLLDEVSSDPERLARFEREARVLASLNHKNIASLHAFEREGDTNFLVMELVEGETLADRIARGPIQVDEALPLFIQIAEGLEAAHEKGVIHRDLKPANIKVSDDGQASAGHVKVLDFGLAKAMALDAGASGDGDLSESPTLTLAATQRGQILGTAAYMAPEQARGKTVDKRADVWAFGVCLFEALSGKRVFEGRTAPDTLANVLKEEPDWDALPVEAPPRLVDLLRRCLIKDPYRRLRDIGEARLALEGDLDRLPSDATAQRPHGRRGPIPLVVALAMVALLAVGYGLGRWLHRDSPAGQASGPVSTEIHLPPDQELAVGTSNPIAFAPDGSRIAYVAKVGETTHLFLRPLDRFEARELSGTDGAFAPFFSPDGRWVGFFSHGELKKVSLDTSEVLSICATGPTHINQAASWVLEDTIVMGLVFNGPLLTVPSGGGVPQLLTDPRAEGDLGHFSPQVLSDGSAVIYSIWGTDGYHLGATSLSTGESKVLHRGGITPHILGSGHLVFMDQEKRGLVVAPFDQDKLELTGAPTTILDGVFAEPAYGYLYLAVSSNGTLAYVPSTGGEQMDRLLDVNRDGVAVTLKEATTIHHVRVSPDGRQVVSAERFGGDYHSADIVVYDLDQKTNQRLTFEHRNLFPAWMSEDDRLSFLSFRPGLSRTFSIGSKAGGEPTEVDLRDGSTALMSALDWSKDGELVVGIELGLATDLARVAELPDLDVPPQSVGTVLPMGLYSLAKGRFEDVGLGPSGFKGLRISPDGKWLAYHSPESGQMEVYVRRLSPGDVEKRLISRNGGREAVWSPATGELLFRNLEGTRMMAVDIETEPDLVIGEPRVLFEGRYVTEPASWHTWDVSPDGKHFYMTESGRDVPPPSIRVVQGWVDAAVSRVEGRR